ncbi:hypothetical protein CRG98_019089 [Punica granatum]|uniref:Uncharacterized protein n=1 Tax=Punica granatum TaxID=22663 RepID=A0A2I0JXP0_PUNGR|nr:hypothetical protein CRG98_019089 [Punica granatum]
MHIEFLDGMSKWKMNLTRRMNFLKKKRCWFHDGSKGALVTISSSRFRNSKSRVPLKITSSGSSTSIRCELNEPREQTIARFISGLNKEIADVVELQPYVFFEDVIKLANKVTIQNPHAVESEVEEVVVDVCGVTSKQQVEYADEGEKLKVQQVMSSESKLEEQWEYLENILKKELRDGCGGGHNDTRLLGSFRRFAGGSWRRVVGNWRWVGEEREQLKVGSLSWGVWGELRGLCVNVGDFGSEKRKSGVERDQGSLESDEKGEERRQVGEGCVRGYWFGPRAQRAEKRQKGRGKGREMAEEGRLGSEKIGREKMTRASYGDGEED